MGSFSVAVSLDLVFGREAETGYGLVILNADNEQTGQAEFTGVGKGFRVIVTSRVPGRKVGLASVDDGHYQDGKWIPERRLNGDEHRSEWFLAFRSAADSHGESHPLPLPISD